MRISVVTVCYNSASTILDTIESVAKQTYFDVEHVIVDGGSKDRTMDIVRSSTSISNYVSEPDKGIYDAMNKGILLATGDVIGTLNADDIYANENILTEISEAFTDKNVDAVYGDLVYVAQDNMKNIIRYWKSKPFKPGLFKQGWMPAHPTFFVRSEVYEKYGMFDLNFKLASDFELTMRLMEKYSIKTKYIPKVFVKMRLGGATNNSLKNIIKGNIESYQACRKNGLRVNILFPIIKIASRFPQFFIKKPTFDGES